MNIFLIGFIALFLAIISIIDLIHQKIYSVILTGMLFFVAFITIPTNPNALGIGVIGFIIAYLLYEAQFFAGIGDVKVMTVISFMLSNYGNLFQMIILTLAIGILWKSIIKGFMPRKKQFAFLPVFLIVYIGLWILGALA
jgi:hypothetical protein